MAWYTILFIVVFITFASKLILSWTSGDIDLDVDFDDTDDIDSSSIFSFKGLIHFLLGFSSYLLLRSTMSSIDKVNGIAQFGTIDYVVATIIGVVLMFLLFFGYKLTLKASNSSKNPEDLINNCDGIVYINLGNGSYSVEAHTLAGTINVTAYYNSNDLEPGMKVKLNKLDNKILITDV